MSALHVVWNALDQAAKQFDLYAEQHEAKRTAEADGKAAVNRAMAGTMREALAEVDDCLPDLRDYFATYALTGLASVHGASNPVLTARQAYEIAAAMMEARKA
ncbi:MAG: hypothetical protein V4653_10660 [Pseudomonadota bacterium]